MNNKEQSATKDMKKYIFKKLRSGAVPKVLIEDVMEKQSIGERQARRIVYDCNATLNTTVEEMANEAASYVMRNLQKLTEDSIEAGDRKSAVKSMELLAKITKITDDRPNITVNANFGFDFDGGEENSDD